VATLVWVIAAIAVLHPAGAWIWAVGAGAGSVVLLVIAARRQGRAAGALLALAAVATAFAGAAAAHVAAAEPSREALLDQGLDGGRAVTMDALIVGKVERTMSGWSFDAVASLVRVGDRSQSTSAPVSVRAAELPAGAAVDLGSLVTVRGTTFAADPGERAVVIVRASDLTVRAPPTGALATASALRHGLQHATRGLPQPAAGLISGLAVGDTSGVEPELDAAMKASSLSHLTAVSGANCALVVGLAFGLAALCGVRRAVRVAAGAIALLGFVLLVSPEPSVVRAAAMALVSMTALLLGRIGAGVSVLCVAVVLLLILDPWLALSLGFGLSAAATAALLLLAGPLAEGLSRWMPPALALAISVPLAAQLACGPLLVLIEPTVPALGLLANLVAAPAAPVATVVGLVACLTSSVPVIASGLTALAWVPAAWVAETARLVAAVPAGGVAWLEGLPGLLALAFVGAGVTALIVPHGIRFPRIRVAAALALALVGGVILATGPLSLVVERLRTPSEWAVAACDVGQGDAVLVRSLDRVALVDTGPEPDALRRCLDRFGIERLDLLVLTHFDLDHRGGLAAVVGRVDTVLHGPAEDAASRGVLSHLVAGGARAVAASEGLEGRLGAARWRVLWAGGAGYTGNDASVVIEAGGGDVPRAIFLGDLSAEPQTLLASRVIGPYDIVKVAHHGSADQDPRLYRRIAATAALLTVGENTYGHPRAETLTLLRGLGARSVRTDLSGAVALWLEDGAVRLWQERDVGAAR